VRNVLYLLRHAKAEPYQLGKNDAPRALSKRGRRDAAALGRWSVTAGVDPDLVISSPATRAVQTADGWARAAGRSSGPIALREEIYQAAASTLLALVRELSPTLESVMLVGHNPGFSELASLLAGHLIELRTCGLAAYAIDGGWADVGRAPARLLFVREPQRSPRA
jgi:phosphohistidine phosphatase